MENNKRTGDDRTSKEFYECFWNEMKNPFLAFIHRTFLSPQLSSSQKQAVTEMLGKSKDK